MKKYPILFLLLAGLAGYLGYRWYSSRTPEVWKLIPDTASVIISSNKLQNSFEPGADTLPSYFRDLPLVGLAAGTLSIIKWFSADQDQINSFLKDKTITYAFHPLAGGRLGIVMYLPVKSSLEEKWLDNPKTAALRVGLHNFQGHPVVDISNEKSEALFSYILKEEYLVISQYGELIEDVIRNAESGKSDKNRAAKILAPLPEGVHDLSIYTNGNTWRDFVFPQALNANLSAFLDLIPYQQGFHLATGHSASNLSLRSGETRISENSYNRLLDDQEGTSFEGADFVSQQTTHLIRLALNNESKFRSAYRKWLQDRRSIASVASFEKAAGKEKDAFYSQIGPEIMLCVNESSGDVSDSKVMLIKFDDFEKSKAVLRKISDKKTSPGGKVKSIQGYDVYPIHIPDLMEGLFGPLFSGFRESYLVYIGPYLVVGNNIQAIRNYLIDYENQLTWTNSPDFDSLNIQRNHPAQLSLITNMSKARAGSEIQKTSLKSSLDEIATIVLNYRTKGKYANLNLDINYSTRSNTAVDTELKTEFEWKDEFPVSFSAMLDAPDGSSAILLTDRNHQLIEISSSPSSAPKVLAQLDGPMIDRAYKADFLNIGRQQHIVSTSAFLYVVDEDDNGLVTVLSEPAGAVVNSIYRMNDSRESSASFVLKGNEQDLFVWKSVLKAPYLLNPKLRFENLLAPVVSFTHGNSNLYIVTQSNGKIFALDESGKPLTGFPIDMLSRIGGAFSATLNSSNGQTEIQGVNRQGEFVKLGLDGRVVARKQLLLPEAGCTFKTLYDENSLDWLLLRQTLTRAAILNKEGKEIFEIINLKPGFSLRYHYFGSDNRFISVVSGGLISIFDFNGNRIGETPIPCEGAWGLTYQSARGELSIFSQVKGKIQLWGVKL